MSTDRPNPTVVHIDGAKDVSFEETAENQKEWECHRLSFFATAALAEIAIIILFGTCTRYGDVAAGSNNSDPTSEDLHQYYPLFQDVNVMIFVGFGFLMTFLHKYGYSSVGLNFVVAALSVQVSILLSGFWERVWENSASGPHPGHGFDEPLELSIIVLIKSLFAAAAVLISMGACLGKTTPSQLLVMAILELFFFGLNETIVAYYLRAVDMGGSMVVHTFGAYFGLAVSRVVSRADTQKDEYGHTEEVAHKDERSSKSSDMFAMVGTLFLWMFWPSFNGALAAGDQQQRVAINTFLSLAACACAAFAADNLMRPGRKFDMVSIQNATLAGGVAVGSSADLVIQPWGAVLIGIIAGTLSVVGYVHIQPCLAKAIGLHDTCGVHNLHGMPGILGGITGAISAAFADSTLGQYASNSQIEGIFAARAPCQTNASLPDWNPEPCGLDASGQASQQAFGLLCTIGLAIVTGILSGFVVKLPCLLPPGHGCKTYCQCGNGLSRKLWFDDRHYWEVPESEEEEGREARHHEEIVVVKAAQVVDKKAAGDEVAGNAAGETKAAEPAGVDATGATTTGSIPHFEIVRSPNGEN